MISINNKGKMDSELCDVCLIMRIQHSVYPRYNVTIEKENQNIGFISIKASVSL